MEVLNKILEKKFLFIFLISFVPLAAALVSQYFFGLHPCELCIYQRVPYAILIFFSILLFSFRNNNRVTISILVLCILAFLANAAIGFYHIGVEEHWWQFGECSGNFDMSNFENFKNSIMNAPNVRCDEVQFRLIGLSMAGWNFLYCLGASAFIAYFYLIRKNLKQPKNF